MLKKSEKNEPSLVAMRALGLPFVIYDYSSYDIPLLWDGGTFHLPRPETDYGPTEWWHELCHWAVSTRKERQYVEFGLGMRSGSLSAIHHEAHDNGDGKSRTDFYRHMSAKEAMFREGVSTEMIAFESLFYSGTAKAKKVIRERSLFTWEDFGGTGVLGGWEMRSLVKGLNVIAKAVGVPHFTSAYVRQHFHNIKSGQE
jgi:hypothetical protein